MTDKVEDKGDDKVEDKGDDKVEDKGDDKVEDKGLTGLLGSGNGSSGGGWVVVSFIGPAGVDIRRLAASVLFGSNGSKARGDKSVQDAVAAALAESRKRAAVQDQIVKQQDQLVKVMEQRGLVAPPPHPTP